MRCSMNKPLLITHPKKARMIAHRGLSGIETENTAAAFVAAGQHPYFGIETDVHKTRDGRFIIIHDDDTCRVCGESRIVEETDFDVLRTLHLKDMATGLIRHDLVLPTLAEYIRILRHYEKHAVLEIKNPMERADIENIIRLIREEDYLTSTTFISFDWQNMLHIRSLLPHQSAQFLMEEWEDDLPERLAKHRLDLDIYYKCLTKERVEKLHEKGILVNVWTVDDAQTAASLCNMGVDQITSNILL